MANFNELSACVGDGQLQERVKVSALIQAHAWMSGSGTPTENQKAWARRMLIHPEADIRGLTWAVVVANRTLTAAQITGASDAAVLAAVNVVLAAYAELG